VHGECEVCRIAGPQRQSPNSISCISHQPTVQACHARATLRPHLNNRVRESTLREVLAPFDERRDFIRRNEFIHSCFKFCRHRCMIAGVGNALEGSLSSTEDRIETSRHMRAQRRAATHLYMHIQTEIYIWHSSGLSDGISEPDGAQIEHISRATTEGPDRTASRVLERRRRKTAIA
jgi:hypothetical protein